MVYRNRELLQGQAGERRGVMNVGWKVEYQDKQGNQETLYCHTLEGAQRLGEQLRAKGYTAIRIYDEAPQSVPQSQNFKIPRCCRVLLPDISCRSCIRSGSRAAIISIIAN